MLARRFAPALAVLLAAACGGAPPADEHVEPLVEETPPGLSVYVGNYPLEYFAQRIAGGRAAVELPVPAGVDPATWQPPPEVILAYQGADLILLNGADYEAWVATATLPGSRVVDTSAHFEDRIIYVEDAYTHSHGTDGQHTHGEYAAVTWLDPILAVRQAEAVREALIAAEPDYAALFRENFATLEGDLLDLAVRLDELVRDAEGAVLLAATHDYHYLARHLDLEIRALRFDPDDPTARSFWHDLEHAAAASTTMLWPYPPPAEARDLLDGLGVRAFVFDPAGAPPAHGDFLSVMHANVDRLAAALAAAAGPRRTP